MKAVSFMVELSLMSLFH